MRVGIPALVCFLAACSSDPAAPASLLVAKTLGDAQTAPVANMVTINPTVTVRDASGQPVSGTQVQFVVVAGGGATSDTIVTTGSSGVAATSWYLGPVPDADNRLRAVSAGVAVEFTATSSEPAVGTQYFGNQAFIEYIPGNLPIIISAPHGGTLTPSAIPDRTSGTLVRDTNTEELARAIGAAFFTRLGKRPHIIICRLRRTKIDANREIVEAAQGNRLAERAWYEWHAYITAAKSKVASDYPHGLYMDLHGHGHDINRLELGYMLSDSELQLSDATLNTSTYVNQSSLRMLVPFSGRTHADLLRGPLSLGTLFENEGFPAVPSSSQPHSSGADYFSGGYNTDRHGSRMGGKISGFQLESHFPGVRDNATNRAAMAEAVVDVFMAYLAQHYDISLQGAVPLLAAR